MTKPTLDTSLISLDATAIKLAAIWQKAIDEIDKLSAWPSPRFARYSICLTNGCDIQTNWKAIQATHGSSIKADPEFPETVNIGIDIFKIGAGSLLVSPATPIEAVAFHMLAHELFHLSEMERMADCSVRFGAHFSGFALAARPGLSEFGIWLLSYLTENYPMIRTKSMHLPPQKKYSPQAWRSADIVSEACADLLALQLMRKTNHDWKAFRSKLISLRIAQETAAQATSLDGASQIGPVEYQIGVALQQLSLLVEQDDPTEIWKECWRLGRSALLQDPFLDPEVKAKLSTSTTMFKPTGRLRKFFQSATW